MLSSIRDITEQKRTQATLERLVEENERLYHQASASLRERDEFIAMASHELKTPLTALRGFAEILQRRGTYVERMVEGIIIQTRRLDRLIRNMLDLSLAESGHLQLEHAPVDLVALAREVAEQTQLLTRQHTVQLELPEQPIIGAWDAGRLEQVLQNLLTNAVKYSPDGGEIRVRVEDLGPAARVSIADQGIGIAPEAASQIFNRFYRTHEAVSSQAGGFGLGLPIARMIVEAHRGCVEVESRLGAGSTFTVTLPYAPAETEAPWTG
jgi:signal transduction histidine kinase